LRVAHSIVALWPVTADCRSDTFLDSLRFRVHLAEHFDVEADQAEAQAWRNGAGIPWSSARIAGVTIGALVEQRGETTGCTSESRTPFVTPTSRSSKAKDSSQLGSGIVAARVANLMFRDERAVIPIGSYNKDFGVTRGRRRRRHPELRTGDVGRVAASAGGERPPILLIDERGPSRWLRLS
jgi:hypothetical protein